MYIQGNKGVLFLLLLLFYEASGVPRAEIKSEYSNWLSRILTDFRQRSLSLLTKIARTKSNFKFAVVNVHSSFFQ